MGSPHSTGAATGARQNAIVLAHALLTVAGGLLAASSWIIARQPQARDLYARVEGWRGGFGILLLAWGLFVLIFRYLLALPATLSAPLDIIVYTVTVLADIAIGFLLGYPLMSRWWLRRNPAAEDKARALRARLHPYQIGLGLTAIVTGVLFLFTWIV